MTDIKSDFSIGDHVKLLADIWDDGEDHHPPGYLARKGETLIIRKSQDRSGRGTSALRLTRARYRPIISSWP